MSAKRKASASATKLAAPVVDSDQAKGEPAGESIVEKIPQVITWGTERIKALVTIAVRVGKMGGTLIDVLDQLKTHPAFSGVEGMLSKGKVQVQLGSIRREQKSEGRKPLPIFRKGAGRGVRKVNDLKQIAAWMEEAEA